MTNKNESKYVMYLANEVYLDQNAVITNKLPDYLPLYAKYKANILQMQVLRGKKESDTSGIKTSKEQLKTDLIDSTLDISRKAEAYASLNNNAILAKEVHYSATDLIKVGDAKLKDRALLIYEKANANLSVLINYGVTAELLASLKTLIGQFNTSIPTMRLGKSGQKQTSDQLNQLFKENDEILAKIDLLIEILHISEPVFYKGYKDIRRVIQTGKSSLAAKGYVTDVNSGEPLKGVSLSFVMEDEAIKSSKSNGSLVKKTAEKGGFYVKSLAAGIYAVTASKIGYVSQVVKLVVNSKEPSNLKIALQKL
jgi:hypothetical protein